MQSLQSIAIGRTEESFSFFYQVTAEFGIEDHRHPMNVQTIRRGFFDLKERAKTNARRISLCFASQMSWEFLLTCTGNPWNYCCTNISSLSLIFRIKPLLIYDKSMCPVMRITLTKHFCAPCSLSSPTSTSLARFGETPADRFRPLQLKNSLRSLIFKSWDFCSGAVIGREFRCFRQPTHLPFTSSFLSSLLLNALHIKVWKRESCTSHEF